MTSDKTVKLHGRTFRMVIPAEEIAASTGRIASRIAADYAGVPVPLVIGVLDGSFMFTAELTKRLPGPLEVSFVKLASYEGTAPSGAPRELVGLKGEIEGRHVIVVEDIVDTGGSVEHLLRSLASHRPASVEIATLFFKPDSFRKDFTVKYRGMEIPDDFVVGFGMDYDGLGRNLGDVYVLDDE